MPNQSSEHQKTICQNCKEAKSLDHYLGIIKSKDTQAYISSGPTYMEQIDHLFAYCPGDPWCEMTPEEKIRKNS